MNRTALQPRPELEPGARRAVAQAWPCLALAGRAVRAFGRGETRGFEVVDTLTSGNCGRGIPAHPGHGMDRGGRSRSVDLARGTGM